MSSSWPLRLGALGMLAAGCGGDGASSRAGIVGGTPTSHTQWPGWVSLYDDTSYVCQGVLVWPDTVLSASHCMDPRKGTPPDRVVVGRDNKVATDGVEYHIAAKCHLSSSNVRTTPGGITLPATCDTSAAGEDDLVLLLLDRPVPASEQRVARLAVASEVTPAGSYQALGWQGVPQSIHQAPIRIVSTCPMGVTGQNICNGGPVLDDGDSGGPLYLEVGGERALAGIYSVRLAGVDFFQSVPAYLDTIPGVAGPLSAMRWRRDACDGDIPGNLSTWRAAMAYALRAGDFNGDGYDDLVAVTGTQIVTWLAGASGTFTRSISPAPPSITDSFGITSVVGEFDDQPGPDLAGVDPAVGNTLRVLGSRPTAGGVDWILSGPPPRRLTFLMERPRLVPELWRARILRAGDVNGDGFDDLATVLFDRVRILLNNGGTGWTLSDPGVSPSLLRGDESKRSTILLADVAPAAGDELVVREECGLAVYQRAPDDVWSRIFGQRCGDRGSLKPMRGWSAAPPDTPLRSGRFNGDACEDLLVRDRDRVRIFYSSCDAALTFTEAATGTLAGWFDSFGPEVPGRRPFFLGWEFWDAALRVGDLDGDGLDDFVGHNPFGVEARVNAGDRTFRAADPFRPMFPAPFQFSNLPTMLLGRFDGPTAPERLLASHDLCLDVWKLTADPQPGTFHVLSPPANADQSFAYTLLEPGGQMQIEVVFSEPVDMTSLAAGVNVILAGETEPNIPIRIVAGPGPSRIFIITQNSVGGSCFFDPNCTVRLSVTGSGPTPVRSLSGQDLDGDDNEIQGGDYTTAFLILG